MKIILKHILRNILEKKGRSLLIVISLMIASVVFILNLTIPNQIIETKTKQARDAIGMSDILVASFNEFNLDDLKMSNEKTEIVGVNDLYLIHKDKTLAIYAVDVSKAASINLTSNTLLKDNEIVISKSAAEKYDYNVNDTMTLELEDSKYDLLIKDIVDSTGLLSFKTLSGIVNSETYNKITGSENNLFRTYYIDVLNDDNIDEVKDYIKENNNSKEFMVEKLIDEEKIKEDNYYTEFILTIIFVMATIMIFFVVSTLNKMIVMERMPVIGTFRSIGASKKKMNSLLILENIIYGLIGGVLGAVVSVIINNFATSLLINSKNITTDMPLSNIIIGILFTIILEILMSITAVIKANKYSIKEIMFESKNSKAGFNKKESIISIILIVISLVLYFFFDDTNLIFELVSLIMFWLGVSYFIPSMMIILSKIICALAKKISSGSLLMAGKNLGYNKLLVSSTRLVVISASIMLVILNVSITFNSMIDNFGIQYSEYSGMIRDVTKNYYEYDFLKNIDNIKSTRYDYMYSGEVTYDNGKSLDAGPMVLGMNNSNPSVDELNYKIEDLKDDECLFDEILLKNNNLKVGDTVEFYFKEYDQKLKVKIVGTVNSYYYSTQREIVVINEKMFKEKITEVPFTIDFSVYDEEKVRDTIELMERELKDPDITIWTIDDFCDIQRKNVNSFMSLFYIIISLALILSFVGIINNQIISFMERVKEIAVLNSVCMSINQLKKMLVIENITSNIVACTFGLIVSVVSLKLMNKLMYGIKMYEDFVYNYNIGFIVMTIVLILLLQTVIVPIRKMKKINIVEAIKYE